MQILLVRFRWTVDTLAAFLDNAPIPDDRTGNDPLVLQLRQFDDDSDIDVVFGNERITIHYEEDLDDLATLDVDRSRVPAGAQVHVTISDFRLNLDPTGEDVWYMNTNGSLSTYADSITVNATTATDRPNTPNWVSVIGDNGGEFTVGGTATEDITATRDLNDPVTPADATDDVPIPNTVRFEETGQNTGVFVSYDSSDKSNIIIADVRASTSFDIEYADESVQMIVEDFDSTLELIRGDIGDAWNAGETLGIRLTAPNLDTNTLADDHMTIDSDEYPVTVLGDPVTLHNVADAAPDLKDGQNGWKVNENTHVATLSTTNQAVNVTITLTADQLSRLQDKTLTHYTHFVSDKFTATTDAQLDIPEDAQINDVDVDPAAIPVNKGFNILQFPVQTGEEVDGIFTITFTATDVTEEMLTQNRALEAAVANATAAAAVDNATPQSVQTAANEGTTDTPSAFRDDIQTAVDETDATAATVLEAIEASAAEHTVTTTEKIIADIFSFGDGAHDAIYRAPLEESSNGGVFEGTAEYAMLNQLDVNEKEAHEQATPIKDELVIVLSGDDVVEVEYDGAHVREDAPTYTGEVTLDADTYRTAGTVTVTLVDPDLNTDGDSVDVYTIQGRYRHDRIRRQQTAGD